MFRNLVTRLLLAIIVTSSIQQGTPLECYVCTSLENPECTSSLSDIKTSTCLLETPSTTSSSTDSTTFPDAEAASTITEASTSSTFADFTFSTTLATESSSPTTLETESSSSTELETESSSSIEMETTPLPTNAETEIVNGSPVLLNKRDETMPSSANNEISPFASEISRLVLSTDNETELPESVSPEPEVRVLREVNEDFACYTLTVIIDGETVTDRGCVVKTSSMCESLKEENYPSHNLTSCTTCTEDGCNSSAINLSGILSAFLSLIALFLTI